MVRWTTLAGLWPVAAILLTPAASAHAATGLQVPAGFVIEKVGGEPGVVFPMFAAFDDRGRLFVTESSGLDLYAEITAGTRKCRVRLLEDRDGDGRFETSRVFVDKLVFPMGVAWRDGRLYVADPPDLVAFDAPAAAGRASRRRVILSRFGHLDNGSLHGLVFGPDGLLYMTTGHPDGYTLTRSDGTVIRGESGALIRCRPDGSEPEVLCRGFENLVEVAFTPRGDVIGTNNWYQKPSGGIRDALVHLVEGGLYPLHPDRGTPLPVTGEPLPPITRFPAVALSGLMRYRGSAFPAELRGNLFSAQHNARKVVRHVLVPDGSTFRARDVDFVTSDDPDFHPSDVLEAADGSLLVVDTGSWYVHHCPTGQIRQSHAPGGIYRVRYAAAAAVPDPWGLAVDWPHASMDQLIARLGDPRPPVRDRARRALAARGPAAVAPLAAVLGGPAGVAVKQRAVWTLGAIGAASALGPLRLALRDAHPDLVAAAARALTLRNDQRAAPDLVRLLSAGTPPVRLAAALALAHCGSVRSLPALWQALAAQPDRFLEHALVYAVSRIADDRALEAALDDPHPRVQKAALLLLDQPPRRGRLVPGLVLRRATAADRELRQAALTIVQSHPEWAGPALGLVRRWLETPALSPDEQLGLRSLILAFQADPAVQELVAAAARPNPKVPVARRVLVLETLAECRLPELPHAWVEALARAIQEPVPAVRRQAVRTAAVVQVPQLDDGLTALAERPDEPLELRLDALRAVVLRRPGLSTAAFELLIGQLEDPEGSPLTRLAAAEVLGRSRLSGAQVVRLVRAARGDPLVAPSVLLPALERSMNAQAAPALLDYLAESVRHGWRPADQELSRVLASVPPALRARAGQVRQLLRQAGAGQRARLARFEPLLAGGSAVRGRAVFFGKKAPCATCHRIGAEGGRIGPDLTRIGAVRSGRDILESILFPSSTIAQGYETFSVATADGRVATGILARQADDTLVLRDSSGGELRIRKDQIQEMKRQPTSIMPEGLERTLTADEFHDLLAFLQSLK